MSAFLLKFLPYLSPRRILYGIAALLLLFMVWKAAAFIDSKYEAEAQIVELQQQIEDHKEAVEMLKKAAAQREAAQKTADAVRTEIDTGRDVIEEIRRKAATAKEEDDGALAPVLRDALRSIDGLR